jgi:hypothetical protein
MLKNVAVAIADTGINLAHLRKKLGGIPAFDAANSWNGPGATTTPGQYPVNHGTMCAYDALIAAPAATLVDVPILANPTSGGSTMAGTLAAAVSAYSHLLARWGVAFAAGDLAKYAGLVVRDRTINYVLTSFSFFPSRFVFALTKAAWSMVVCAA